MYLRFYATMEGNLAFVDEVKHLQPLLKLIAFEWRQWERIIWNPLDIESQLKTPPINRAFLCPLNGAPQLIKKKWNGWETVDMPRVFKSSYTTTAWMPFSKPPTSLKLVHSHPTINDLPQKEDAGGRMPYNHSILFANQKSKECLVKTEFKVASQN